MASLCEINLWLMWASSTHTLSSMWNVTAARIVPLELYVLCLSYVIDFVMIEQHDMFHTIYIVFNIEKKRPVVYLFAFCVPCILRVVARVQECRKREHHIRRGRGRSSSPSLGQPMRKGTRHLYVVISNSWVIKPLFFEKN